MILSLLSRKITTIHAAALILGAAGFLSRLLGLFRDRLLAGVFGASRELDVYYAAFQVPDFVYSILLLGAGSMAILPIFFDALGKGKEEAENFISELLRFFFIVAIFVIGIGMLFAPEIMGRLFVGFSQSELSSVTFLTRMMFLSPLFLGFSGIFMSVSQAHHKFIAYSLSSILYNVGIISGIFIAVPFFGAQGLGIGVVCGAFLHLAIQLFVYRHLGFRIIAFGNIWSSRIREVLFLSLPRVISLSLSQITFAILLGIASTLSAGSIAVFQFANNLAFLPVGVFAISYATALFPRLAEAATSHDAEKFWGHIFFGIRMILFWIVPVSFLLIVLRAHIVRVVLGAGQFDWSDTRLTAAAVAILAGALIAESLNGFFVRAFYAVRMTWLPLSVNLFSIVAAISSAHFFTRTLQESPHVARIVYSFFRIPDVSGGEILGVALGFAVLSVVNAILQGAILFIFIRKWILISGALIFGKELLRPIGKIIFASAIGAFTARQILQTFSVFFSLDTFAGVFLQGVFAGIAGIIVWGALLYSMKSDDFDALLLSLRRKLFTIDVLPREWNGERAHQE
ncbi:MAG: murein biosynthesis integral membrane protein MurJ [Patescibacteria group bacterium]